MTGKTTKAFQSFETDRFYPAGSEVEIVEDHADLRVIRFDDGHEKFVNPRVVIADRPLYPGEATRRTVFHVAPRKS